jgi:hypothetical protein
LLVLFLTDNQRQRLGHGAVNQELHHPLPDLVQCHGLLFDLSFESRRPSHLRLNPQPNQPNDVEPFPLIQDFEGDEEEGWSFALKFSVSPWRTAGRELRQIADQFEFEVRSKNRNRTE